MRLRDCPSKDFTWRDLEVFISFLDNDSHLVAAVHPERATWTQTALLLAEIVDTLRILVWQNTQDARDGKNFPKRIPRPGVSEPEPRKGSQVKPQPLSTIKKIYGDQAPEDLERQRKLAALFRG